jgi:hypothetical protein
LVRPAVVCAVGRTHRRCTVAGAAESSELTAGAEPTERAWLTARAVLTPSAGFTAGSEPTPSAQPSDNTRSAAGAEPTAGAKASTYRCIGRSSGWRTAVHMRPPPQ